MAGATPWLLGDSSWQTNRRNQPSRWGAERANSFTRERAQKQESCCTVISDVSITVLPRRACCLSPCESRVLSKGLQTLAKCYRAAWQAHASALSNELPTHAVADREVTVVSLRSPRADSRSTRGCAGNTIKTSCSAQITICSSYVFCLWTDCDHSAGICLCCTARG